MMLCDYAQAAEGKLNIIGGGWSIKALHAPMAVALKIEVPWQQTNEKHAWKLRLETADGAPVTVDTPVGAQPVEVGQEFEVGRPPGLPAGTPIDLLAAVNFGVVPLTPAARYQWKLEIDNHSEPDWHLSFLTREVTALEQG